MAVQPELSGSGNPIQPVSDVWMCGIGIVESAVPCTRDQNVTGRARAGALGRERAAGKAAERGREFYRGRRLGVRKRREGDKAKRESGLQTWQYEAGTPWKYNDFDQISNFSHQSNYLNYARHTSATAGHA